MTYHILIVEDEIHLAQIISDYLLMERFETTILDDGSKVIDFVQNNTVDVILLDLMLPNKDGISICRELRQFTQVPIIMTTARVDEIDRILGLEIGANDYVCKPYSPRELVARVKVQLRNLNPEGANKNHIRLHTDSLKVSYNNSSVELTFVEFNLFKKLYEFKGRIFNRDQLMDSIYHDGRIVSDRTIDSHIKKIRKKLNKLDPSLDCIQSIYGCGYKFECG